MMDKPSDKFQSVCRMEVEDPTNCGVVSVALRGAKVVLQVGIRCEEIVMNSDEAQALAKMIVIAANRYRPEPPEQG